MYRRDCGLVVFFFLLWNPWNVLRDWGGLLGFTDHVLECFHGVFFLLFLVIASSEVTDVLEGWVTLAG